jgi:hypothetical protein
MRLIMYIHICKAASQNSKIPGNCGGQNHIWGIIIPPISQDFGIIIHRHSSSHHHPPMRLIKTDHCYFLLASSRPRLLYCNFTIIQYSSSFSEASLKETPTFRLFRATTQTAANDESCTFHSISCGARV